MVNRLSSLALCLGLLTTSVSLVYSYNSHTAKCERITAQQKASTGHAVNWGKVLDNVPLQNARYVTMAELEQVYPATCEDDDTWGAVMTALFLGFFAFVCFYFPLAGLRAALKRGNA